MPLRRTERSDGRPRPRWKDGSHVPVESSTAETLPRRATAAGVHPEAETPVVAIPSPRKRYGSQSDFTRGRLDNAEADAWIAESEAHGEVRLAILPYGRRYKRDSCPRMRLMATLGWARGPTAGEGSGRRRRPLRDQLSADVLREHSEQHLGDDSALRGESWRGGRPSRTRCSRRRASRRWPEEKVLPQGLAHAAG